LNRLGVQNAVSLPALLAELKLDNADALFLALGAGDMNVAQVGGAIQRLLKDAEPIAPTPRRSPDSRRKRSTGLDIEGIGDLVSTFARCCSPLPPEPIAAYVTVGRGVTVHRASCASLERMRRQHPERVLSVEWGRAGEQGFEVDVALEAYDRRGLVRDVSGLLTDEKISIVRMATETDRSTNIARIDVTITIRDLEELSRLLTRLKSLPNVIGARRLGRP